MSDDTTMSIEELKIQQDSDWDDPKFIEAHIKALDTSGRKQLDRDLSFLRQLDHAYDHCPALYAYFFNDGGIEWEVSKLATVIQALEFNEPEAYEALDDTYHFW